MSGRSLISVTLLCGIVISERKLSVCRNCLTVYFVSAAWAWDQVGHSGCVVSIGWECKKAAIDPCRFWQQQPDFWGYWNFIWCSDALHWWWHFISTQGFQVQWLTCVWCISFSSSSSRCKSIILKWRRMKYIWRDFNQDMGLVCCSAELVILTMVEPVYSAVHVVSNHNIPVIGLLNQY